MRAVIAISSISYLYSSIRGNQLSNKIEEEKWNTCIEQCRSNCELVSKYQDDCFDPSYRAEYRIKTFRPGEYDRCMDNKIEQYRSSMAK